jgi:hypothetical protein
MDLRGSQRSGQSVAITHCGTYAHHLFRSSGVWLDCEEYVAAALASCDGPLGSTWRPHPYPHTQVERQLLRSPARCYWRCRPIDRPIVQTCHSPFLITYSVVRWTLHPR